MNYNDFEGIVSSERLARYLKACNGDKRKAMILYRYNLHASEAMYSIISCFEIALRNAIDKHMTTHFGNDWLRDSILNGGIFNLPILHKTRDIINCAYQRVQRGTGYTHPKLLAEMEFGIWKYMFSPVQYRQSGKDLLKIFPNKPRSSRQAQYNRSTIFNELDRINSLRNRIAHHEPICFVSGTSDFDSTYIETTYQKAITLFNWLGIDAKSYLFGLDHVRKACDRIKSLKEKL